MAFRIHNDRDKANLSKHLDDPLSMTSLSFIDEQDVVSLVRLELFLNERNFGCSKTNCTCEEEGASFACIIIYN